MPRFIIIPCVIALSLCINSLAQSPATPAQAPSVQSVTASAPEPPKPQVNIAIVDLEGRGVSADEALTLSDRLRNVFVQAGTYSVIERGQMNEILKEQGFQQSGCATDACMVQMGQVMGVHRIVAGSIGRVGGIYLLSLRMIDIATGKIISMVDEEVEGKIENILKFGMKNAVYKLCGVKSGTPEVKTDTAPAPDTVAKAIPVEKAKPVVVLDTAVTATPVSQPAQPVKKTAHIAILTPRYTFVLHKGVSLAVQDCGGIEWDAAHFASTNNVVLGLSIMPLDWLVIPVGVEYKFATWESRTSTTTSMTYVTGGRNHNLILTPRVFAGHVARYGFVYGGIGWSHTFFLNGVVNYINDSTVPSKPNEPYTNDFVLDVNTGLRLSFFRPYAFLRSKSNVWYFGGGMSFGAIHEWLLFNLQWTGWNTQKTTNTPTGSRATYLFNNGVYFGLGVNVHMHKTK